MPSRRSCTGSKNCRAQSSVIEVVLIIGLTILGVTGALLFGVTALDDAHTATEMGAAELSMTQLDSHLSLVALGPSSTQGSTVDVRSGTSLTVQNDSGFMNVSVVNRTDGGLRFVVLNTTLGAIVYENNGKTVAYQGGGVWKRAETGGSTMISPPEFHYRTRRGTYPTLTLPLVVVQGEDSLSGDLRVKLVGTAKKFPQNSLGRTNPLDRGEVNVTVQSDYYEAWGAFFEQRTDASVTYDHSTERVSISLGVRPGAPGIPGGLVSGATGTALTFEDQAEADSYNSSLGDYNLTSAEDTRVVAAGPVELHNHATVYGNLIAGDYVTLQNKAKVTGNVSHGGSLTNDGTISGWTRSRAAVEIPNSAGWLIREKIAAFDSANDNSGTPAIDNSETLTGCNTTCTLQTGDYILENVTLGTGEELVLDTSGGDVEVAVRQDVKLQSDGTIRVTGGGMAKFYVDGDLVVMNDGNATVPDQRSPGLWFYMYPGTDAIIKDQGRLVGVIYGPGSGAETGVDITFTDQAVLYGGAVGAVDSVPNGIGVHFDEALTSEDPLAGTGGDEPSVTFMHVTLTRVNVSSQGEK